MEPAESRNTPFARALRRAITERQWSNRTAATMLGVSHTQVGRYLTGADPGLSTAKRLADHLGVTLDELYDEDAVERALAPVDVVINGVTYAPATALDAGVAATAEARAALQAGEQVALDAEAAAQRGLEKDAPKRRRSAG